MKKLYDKNELAFALLWIGLYVLGMNIALRFCGGFDDLAAKTVPQLLVPVGCILLLAVLAGAWVSKHKLGEKYGLCPFKGNIKVFLYFIPLILMSCINLKNGLGLPAALPLSILMMLNLALAGYVEEVIFRGFLFRALLKDGLKSAIIISAVTFGIGHIVNLANTADTVGTLLQVCYAIAIGFMYTLIALKGGSIWPCIIGHMFVNGSSVFAREQGAFTRLCESFTGSASPLVAEFSSALLIIVISGGYALWLWKKAE